jgi:DNA-binding transcriptional regulator YhcF (GntR family)
MIRQIRVNEKSSRSCPFLNCVRRSLLIHSIPVPSWAHQKDVSNSIKKNPRNFIYARIANGLRKEILAGKYAPGTRLPTIRELASIWDSNYFRAHNALTILVKEGWLERVRGSGTYVTHWGKRFQCAGIYHAINIWSKQEALFARELNECLIERLHALKKTTQIFVDTRPIHLHGELPPDLVEAIYNRRIQCVIAANVDSPSNPTLSNLSLPVALMTATHQNNAVHFEERGFIQESLRHLVRRGCRSVGVISNSPSMHKYFLKETKTAGLTTREEWNFHLSRYNNSLKEFGYWSFRRLHRLSERPDGLIVYPDMAAEGTILAILQCGIRIPEEMKLVVHSNARIPLICPFPVTWAISDEDAAAAALIQTIEKQFAGERPQQVNIPFTFKDDTGKAWLT